MQSINSYTDLIEKISSLETSYLLLYKSGTDASTCTFDSVLNASAETSDTHVFSADVNSVKDIHPQFDIKTVPSLLKFNKDKFVSVYKGCNDPSFYTSIFNNEFHVSEGEQKQQKNVTVYSTPTCSWCTRLKNYLKENNIRFRDIDVSKDQKAAEDMVKRSGQQGVPQTLIDGTLIMGFDKAKIDRLLGIG
jgi:glutaredoxin-like YruB-family protein